MLEQNLQSSAQSTTQSCVLKQSSPASVSEKDTHYPKQALSERSWMHLPEGGAQSSFSFLPGTRVDAESTPSQSHFHLYPGFCSTALSLISSFQASSFPFSFPLLLFSLSVVLDSLWPHGLQHARIPCPSSSPGVCSNSCPLSWWCFSQDAAESGSCRHPSGSCHRVKSLQSKHFFLLLTDGLTSTQFVWMTIFLPFFWLTMITLLCKPVGISPGPWREVGGLWEKLRL